MNGKEAARLGARLPAGTTVIAAILAVLPVLLGFPAGATAAITFDDHVIAYNFDGASSIHPVDLDKDGDIDVLGCAFYGDELTLWLNPGTGPDGWPATVIDGAFDGAHYVNTGDLDDDGDLDIVGAAQLAGELAWWRNDGGDPILWTRISIDNAYNGAQQVYPVDMDGDQDLDLVACAYLIDDVSWYRNDGGDPPVWTRRTITTSADGVVSAWPVDLDDDGDIDVLSASYDNGRVHWHRNDGDSSTTWTSLLIDGAFGGAHEVRSADLDGDGLTDVLAAAFSLSDLAWWRNDGGDPSGWVKQIVAPSFTGASSIASADLDADGDMDILGAAHTKQDIAWWSNEGGDPLTWTKQVIDGELAEAWPLTGVDMDGDGDLDVLAAGRAADRVVWYENQTTTAAPSGAPAPRARIDGAAPNPFNPSVEVRFTLDSAGETRLEVFDVAGRRVALLAGGTFPAGSHAARWNGRDGAGRPAPSGVYLVRLAAGATVDSERIVLIR
ncbi:MAG: VCBS repeat-containing protein [Candidatus Eisenbacteria bacterium]|nr:VCBS repeat-containing protein [Candidatus Eisenbacteria bacterium]